VFALPAGKTLTALEEATVALNTLAPLGSEESDQSMLSNHGVTERVAPWSSDWVLLRMKPGVALTSERGCEVGLPKDERKPRRFRLTKANPLMPAALAFLLCGCSYNYHFDISGVVRSADGEPLAGVKIVLDPIGDGSGWDTEFISKPDGTFSYELLETPNRFDDGRLPTYVLWFSKEGYVKEKVDISPKRKPSSYKQHVPIVVEPRLQRSEQDP
jgi:hypothetical protein